MPARRKTAAKKEPEPKNVAPPEPDPVVAPTPPDGREQALQAQVDRLKVDLRGAEEALREYRGEPSEISAEERIAAAIAQGGNPEGQFDK